MAKKKEIVDYEINFEEIEDNYNLLNYFVLELLLDKCYKNNIPELMISNNNSSWNGFYISKQHNKKYIVDIYNTFFSDSWLTSNWYPKGIYKVRINWGSAKFTKQAICNKYFKAKLLTQERVNEYLKCYNRNSICSPNNLNIYLNNKLFKTFTYYNFPAQLENTLELINDNDDFYIVMELSKFNLYRSNYSDDIYKLLNTVRQRYDLDYLTNNEYLKSESIKEFVNTNDPSSVIIGQQLYLSKNTLNKFGHILYDDNHLAKTIFDKLKQKQNGAEVL